MQEISNEANARIHLLQNSDTLTDLVNQAYLVGAPYEVIEPFVRQIDDLTLAYNRKTASVPELAPKGK